MPSNALPNANPNQLEISTSYEIRGETNRQTKGLLPQETTQPRLLIDREPTK